VNYVWTGKKKIVALEKEVDKLRAELKKVKEDKRLLKKELSNKCQQLTRIRKAATNGEPVKLRSFVSVYHFSVKI